MTSIPYTGAQALARIAARTTVARVTLALALLVLVILTALAARHPKLNKQPLLPANSGGMLVLDLSASISSDTYSRIGETLNQLAARGGNYGLVVFSSTAYEALPPGSPAAALKSLVRYFSLPKQAAAGEQPIYPVNPWTNSFSTGTHIAEGLDLARRIEVANHVKKKAVVLISDLADDPVDLSRLNDVLLGYKAAKIRLKVIPLNATPTDLDRYTGYAEKILPAALPGEHPSASAPAHASFPTTLFLLTIVVALLLGASELRSARLRWGGSAEAAA
jgi:hypothetical protein